MDHMIRMMAAGVATPAEGLARDAAPWGWGAPSDPSILALLTEGLTDGEIAAQRGSSLWSVHRDVARLLRGMGILSRTPAVDAALRRGSLGRLAAGPDWRPVLVSGG